MIVEPFGKPGVEETRTRILAAARELYANKGSRGTTTREVAERAGVNEATLFRHFGTKGQLLTAMLDHFSAASAFPEMMQHARSFATIEEQLQFLGMSIVEAVRRKEDLIKVTMAEEFTNPEAHTCAFQAPYAARGLLGEYFAERVASGAVRGDPLVLARVFMSLFFSYVMARKIWSDFDQPPEVAVANIVEIFLNGALAK